MNPTDDDLQFDFDAQHDPQGDLLDEEAEAERERLLEAISSGKLDTLQERVAWLLNTQPETRDSDLRLQIAFWEEFESDVYDGECVTPTDLFQLTRLTSITRARRKVQNSYKLFQASSEVRQMRGTLSDEEREKAREQRPPLPLFMVYADESGKTADHMLVGSIWFLHAPETLAFVRALAEWRRIASYDSELHFKSIDNSNIDRYLDLVDVIASASTTVSYKTLSVERRGVGNVSVALATLYYHLLVRGVEHESQSGRATLPRRLQLWKDAEEPGADRLLLADLGEKLRIASKTRFDDQLEVDVLKAMDSKKNELIQVADLYTSSLNRVLNASGSRSHPKDRFADQFLQRLGVPHGPQLEERAGDMTVHIAL